MRKKKKTCGGRTHSLRVSTELCLTRSAPNHIRVDCHMEILIDLWSLVSLSSYQWDCMIDWIYVGRIVSSLAFAFPGPLNCPLFYSSFFKGQCGSTGLSHCEEWGNGGTYGLRSYFLKWDGGWWWDWVMEAIYLPTSCLQLWHPARLWSK